jgi:hypothetical protein
MAAAQYLVAREPGVMASGPGFTSTDFAVGSCFVRPGGVFEAPDSYIPPVGAPPPVYPMNEEALEALRKAADARQQMLAARAESLAGADRSRVEVELRDLEGVRPRLLRVVTADELGGFRSKGPIAFRR